MENPSGTSPEIIKPKFKKKGISRREFLNLSKLLPLASFPFLLSEDSRISNTDASVVDFFDTVKIRPDSEEATILREMGASDFESETGLIHSIPQNQQQAAIFFEAALGIRFRNHGRQVMKVMSEIYKTNNFSKRPFLIAPISAEKAIHLKEIEKSPLGNWRARLIINPKIIHELVSQTQDSIINLSLQPGIIPLEYVMYQQENKYNLSVSPGPVVKDSQGNILSRGKDRYYNGTDEITEEEYLRLEKESAVTQLLEPHDRIVNFTDGFAGENTYNNLLHLTDIAGLHPEKLFVVAGGNPKGISSRPDIREARKQLELSGLWPPNIIVVGYETSLKGEYAYTGPASLGADIYVTAKDLKKLGFPVSSSFATPVVTELIRQIVAKDKNRIPDIKHTLAQMTETKEAWDKNEKFTYPLLNLEKARNLLKNLGK